MLNDDCLGKILKNLSRDDLVSISSIRNHRIKFGGESVFIRKCGKSLSISKDESEIATCRTFGHLCEKLVIEFREEDIEIMSNVVMKYVNTNLEELEIRHLTEANERSGSDQRLEVFMKGLCERFPNLKRLKFDYRDTPLCCCYLKDIANLNNIESITFIEKIDFWNIVKFQYQYLFVRWLRQGVHWVREVVPEGYLFTKIRNE